MSHHPRRRSLSKWRRVEPRPRESWWTRPIEDGPRWQEIVGMFVLALVSVPVTLYEAWVRLTIRRSV